MNTQKTYGAFCCWMAKHTSGADHVRMCENYRETSGEHVQDKLADYPYAAEPARDVCVFGVVAEAEQTFWKCYREMTSDERYATQTLPTPGRRSWTPTPAEILMATGIVVAIIVIFCFVVIAYDL